MHMIAIVFTLVKKENMIKTHTNTELLNDLRKLCKGVKEIRIIFHTNEENDFDYSDVIEFLDADGNYIDEDELNDAYDSLFEFDYSDPYELKQVSINWRLFEYLEDLLDASGIHLCQIWWQGAFILDLDNGVVTLEADNCENPEEIRYELEGANYLSEEAIEDYLKDLPDFYFDENKEQSKKFAPYGYADNNSLVPIVKFLMCNEM